MLSKKPSHDPFSIVLEHVDDISSETPQTIPPGSYVIYAFYNPRTVLPSVIDQLDSKVSSMPRRWFEITKVISLSVKMLPYYVTSYSLNSELKISSGTVIKGIELSSILITDANSGMFLKDPFLTYIITGVSFDLTQNLEKIYSRLQNRIEFNLELDSDDPRDYTYALIEWLPNRLSIPEIDSNVKRHLKSTYEQMVTYTGANRVKYTRQLQVKDKDITIHKNLLIYIPRWIMTLQILNESITMEFFQNSAKEIFLETKLQCPLCRGRHPNWLCNDCGKIVHKGSKLKFWKREGRFCKHCQRSLCEVCFQSHQHKG